MANFERRRYNNDSAIKARFAEFAKEVVKSNADKEYALVVTTDNKCVTLRGNRGGVDIAKYGSPLKGAKVIHTHPDEDGFLGDCFSREDIESLIGHELKYLEIASGLGRYRVSYHGGNVTKSVDTIYAEAYAKGAELYDENDVSADYPQLRAMRSLSKILKGIVFEEMKL